MAHGVYKGEIYYLSEHVPLFSCNDLKGFKL